MRQPNRPDLFETHRQETRLNIFVNFAKKMLKVDYLGKKIVRHAFVCAAAGCFSLTAAIGNVSQALDRPLSDCIEWIKDVLPSLSSRQSVHIKESFHTGISSWMASDQGLNLWTILPGSGVTVGGLRLHKDLYQMADYSMEVNAYIEQRLTIVLRAANFDRYYGWRLSRRTVGGLPALFAEHLVVSSGPQNAEVLHQAAVQHTAKSRNLVGSVSIRPRRIKLEQGMDDGPPFHDLSPLIPPEPASKVVEGWPTVRKYYRSRSREP